MSVCVRAFYTDAEAVLDDLLIGLSIPHPALFIGLPRGHPEHVWAVSNPAGIFLAPRCERLSRPALVALLAHEVGHQLVAKHGGRFEDEDGATAAGRALLADDSAWRALIAEACVRAVA